MFGMTMAFAAAGLTQTYLEQILGIGDLDTQPKLLVHFPMLVATGALSSRASPSTFGTSSSWPAGP